MTVAIDAARAAGKQLLESFEGVATGVDAKSSAHRLVSDADRGSETVIVSAIRWAFPGDAIVAEEGSLEPGGSGRTWYIDPLDGTTNYLYGVPHWGVVLCLADADGALAGVVYDPVRDELFGAERGGGAWSRAAAGSPRAAAHDCGRRPWQRARRDGFRLRRGRSQGAGAHPHARARRGPRPSSLWLGRARSVVGRRRTFDAYFESVDKPWDWMAGALIVREAGGRVTELKQARSGHPHIVASAPAVHDALVALLKRAVQPG